MNTINPEDIDFSKYLESYPEHANVLPAFAYAEAVEDYFYGDRAHLGIDLPWSKSHGKIRLRPGEVSIWAGVNGHGKSLLLNQVVLQAISNGEACCIASMEMKPVSTMARMTRQAVGVSEPSPDYIRKFHQWTTGHLWLYDQQGTIHADRILAVLRYCNEALYWGNERVKIKHFIIDSLMKCGIGVDDYNRQKSFLDELCSHARDTGVHIHLVAHARKGETEKRVSDKFDIKGTSEITDQVDNVFTVWRNKHKEEESQKPAPDEARMKEPDALLICSKQRHGEWEGKIALWFHKDSMTYVGSEGQRPIDFINRPRNPGVSPPGFVGIDSREIPQSRQTPDYPLEGAWSDEKCRSEVA